MNIVFSDVWQIKVIDVPHTRDVDTTRSHISRNQHADFTGFECSNRPLALSLGFVPVDRRCGEAFRFKELIQFFTAMFGPAKHQCQLVTMRIKQLDQQFGFRRLRYIVQRLANLFHGHARWVYLYTHRVF